MKELRAKLMINSCNGASRRRAKPTISAPGPPVRRAPEEPEGLAAVPVGGGGAWPGTPEPQAPPVWRAPEGPEGTGGLRGAAPNEVRTPSLAGGRGLRRPEHQRGNKHQHAARTARGRAAAHGRTKQPGPTSQARRRPEHQRSRKQQAQSRIPAAPPVWRAQEGLAAVPVGGGRAWPRCRWVAAGPGRASRSTTPSRRLACGDLAGGPPPTGTHSGPAPQAAQERCAA